MLQTDVKISAAGGKTIEAFQQLIQQRIQWCNETKEDAVAAIAITALRSIRAATHVANENKIQDLNITTTPFVPSFTQVGSHKRPCLRNNGGVRYELTANERMIFDVINIKGAQVYKYEEERKGKKITYYIVAHSVEAAQNIMTMRIVKRIKSWKGLARKALSVLMTKTCTLNDNDQANPNVTQTADSMTKKRETKNGQEYQLDLSDLLDYATLAVEGGDNTVDTALKKAANKAASVINMKCKNIFNFEKIETPFPEVSKKRK